VLGTGLSEALLPRGIVTGQRSGVLVGLGLAHQPRPLARLAQAGVVDLAGGLQPGQQRPFLGRAHLQRHLTHKGRGALGGLVSRPGLPDHACLLGEDK
jgi:hypothetical protein